jgi:hypothetical protein
MSLCDRVTGAWLWDSVEAQLWDSDSSTGNKSDKSPPHEQKVLKNKYPEVTIEKCYEEQNLLYLFISLQRREAIDMLY